MPPGGFEPAIPASERPQTYALDRVASGTGTSQIIGCSNKGVGVRTAGRLAHMGDKRSAYRMELGKAKVGDNIKIDSKMGYVVEWICLSLDTDQLRFF